MLESKSLRIGKMVEFRLVSWVKCWYVNYLLDATSYWSAIDDVDLQVKQDIRIYYWNAMLTGSNALQRTRKLVSSVPSVWPQSDLHVPLYFSLYASSPFPSDTSQSESETSVWLWNTMQTLIICQHALCKVIAHFLSALCHRHDSTTHDSATPSSRLLCLSQHSCFCLLFVGSAQTNLWTLRKWLVVHSFG